MRKIYFAAALVASSLAFAQTEGKVGLNTSTPEATLEIKPNAANALTSATTKEGILIPRVSRLRASNMGTDVTESTMVYISDISDGSASGTTADVDAKGFYYFDGTKWVKMKGTGGASTAGATIKDIRTVTSATDLLSSDWTSTDYTIVLGTGFNGDVGLPNPATSTGRVIAIRNISGANRNYVPYTPVNNGSVRVNRGHVLQCDGTDWHVIGGF